MTPALTLTRDNVARQLRERCEAWEADKLNPAKAFALAGFLGANAFWHDPYTASEGDTDALNEYYRKNVGAISVACYAAGLPERHALIPESPHAWASYVLANRNDAVIVSTAINAALFETFVLAVCNEEVKPAWYRRTMDDTMFLASMAHAGYLSVFKPALRGIVVTPDHVYPGFQWWKRIFDCIQKH